jgi:hypothetical protein
MLPPSNEQLSIISELKDNNVIVDAIAGSGKTTTILHIAKENSDKSILLLTYNSRLRLETRQRATALKTSNLIIHTYHSFCTTYYKVNDYTDIGIITSITNNIGEDQFSEYDMIILDECQDLTSWYYQLVCKILAANINKIKICIFGDKNQSIYEFNEADSRYITKADYIFEPEVIWSTCKLSYSFRITNEIADFVNHCMLGERRMNALKSGPKPVYEICNLFKNRPGIVILNYIKMGYKYDEIFVLAASIRSPKSAVRRLANFLTENKIPIYVPSSDDEIIDEEVSAKKIVFSSFHQSKGLERKVVIIMGYDDSYFEFFDRNGNKDICPNVLYVAVTRAKEYLHIFHDMNRGYLPFLKHNNLTKTCNVLGSAASPSPFDMPAERSLSVTNFIRHIPIEIVVEALKFIECETISEPTENLRDDIPSKIFHDGSCENVSDITGMAIPIYFEYCTYGKSGVIETILQSELSKFVDKRYGSIGNFRHILKIKPVECCLFIACLHIAKLDKLLYKIYQIRSYNWLPDTTANKCIENLKIHISENRKLNVESFMQSVLDLDYEHEKSKQKIILVGTVDMLDSHTQTIWEVKCVESLLPIHKLQLACYMYIFLNKYSGKRFADLYKFKLINAFTGEVIQIKSNLNKLQEMVLLIHRYRDIELRKPSDDEFINLCLQKRNKYR